MSITFSVAPKKDPRHAGGKKDEFVGAEHRSAQGTATH